MSVGHLPVGAPLGASGELSLVIPYMYNLIRYGSSLVWLPVIGDGVDSVILIKEKIKKLLVC